MSSPKSDENHARRCRTGDRDIVYHPCTSGVSELNIQRVYEQLVDTDACPRRYCWWWRTRGFAWDQPVAHFCEAHGLCGRLFGDTYEDQFEPCEPEIWGDGFRISDFLRPDEVPTIAVRLAHPPVDEDQTRTPAHILGCDEYHITHRTILDRQVRKRKINSILVGEDDALLSLTETELEDELLLYLSIDGERLTLTEVPSVEAETLKASLRRSGPKWLLFESDSEQTAVLYDSAEFEKAFYSEQIMELRWVEAGLQFTLRRFGVVVVRITRRIDTGEALLLWGEC